MRKQVWCIAMCMAVIFSLAGCGSNTTGGSNMSDSHYSVSNEDNKTELETASTEQTTSNEQTDKLTEQDDTALTTTTIP